MIEDEIKQVVADHYRGDGADLLLLSSLGSKVRRSGNWPVPGETRALIDVVEAIDTISVVRDDNAQSFIAIVPKGEEKRAISKITDRRKRYFLDGLPRPLLLAFSLPMAAGQVMGVRLGSKLTYEGGPQLGEGLILVDDDLRMPGLDVRDLRKWSSEEVEALEANIRTWAERHKIDLGDLSRPSRSEGGEVQAPTSLSSSAQGSALDRLYAAQDPDVARRIVMPIDIALALSRMP